jgi:hypothetical protein
MLDQVKMSRSEKKELQDQIKMSTMRKAVCTPACCVMARTADNVRSDSLKDVSHRGLGSARPERMRVELL